MMSTMLHKLHNPGFINRLIADLDKRVCEIMNAEDYTRVEVKDSEEFFKCVDKYEIDLTDFLKAKLESQIQKEDEGLPKFGSGSAFTEEIKYPLLLPYSRSVVKLNDLVGEFLNLNLSYWQFLLADKADFSIAYSSCDRLLLRLGEVLSNYFFHG